MFLDDYENVESLKQQYCLFMNEAYKLKISGFKRM